MTFRNTHLILKPNPVANHLPVPLVSQPVNIRVGRARVLIDERDPQNPSAGRLASCQRRMLPFKSAAIPETERCFGGELTLTIIPLVVAKQNCPIVTIVNTTAEIGRGARSVGR